MPCTKCNSDFNVFNWKMKCYECDENYCSKCVRRQEGFLFCDICVILIKRPPSRGQLMGLKSKDLQQYLNKNNISTHGLVEKQELVELFCRNSIPVRHKKFNRKFPVNMGGSVPNLAARSQCYLNNLRSNAETAFYNHTRNVWPPNQGVFSAATSPTRQAYAPARTAPPPPPPPQSTTQPEPHNTQFPTNLNNTGSTSSVPPDTPSQVQPEENVSPSPKKYLKLSDFETEEQLSDLSVKQLKEILLLNRMDFKGCVEKGELLERVSRLWNDSNQHKNDDFARSIDECCKICMDAPLDCVLLECGHIATCIDCGKQLAECPICRQYVTRVVRTFKA